MNELALKAFEKLKQLMSTDVLLRFPDFDAAEAERPFVILTDASQEGFGAI